MHVKDHIAATSQTSRFYVKKFNLAAPQSALAITCVISDINAVSYPKGVSSPNPMLNQHANEDGKFRCVSTLDLLSSKVCLVKGPPLSAMVPSPHSQSPALPSATPIHQTHSHCPSALGQDVPIKDGVSVPWNNASAIKPGQALILMYFSRLFLSFQVQQSLLALYMMLCHKYLHHLHLRPSLNHQRV